MRALKLTVSVVIGFALVTILPAQGWARSHRSAEGHAAALAEAVDVVQQQAASIPAPTTPQAAIVARARIQPAVNAALAQGTGADAPLMAIAKTDPTVAAALLTHVTGQATGSQPTASTPPEPPGAPSASDARARVRAHAADYSVGCWGPVWTQYTWALGGATVGWVYDTFGLWCGNNLDQIYYAEAPQPKPWAWGPWCIANFSQTYEWDGSYTWQHLVVAGSFGTNYVFGCFAENGGSAALRIAANGYWDRYDDFPGM